MMVLTKTRHAQWVTRHAFFLGDECSHARADVASRDDIGPVPIPTATHTSGNETRPGSGSCLRIVRVVCVTAEIMALKGLLLLLVILHAVCGQSGQGTYILVLPVLILNVLACNEI